MAWDSCVRYVGGGVVAATEEYHFGEVQVVASVSVSGVAQPPPQPAPPAPPAPPPSHAPAPPKWFGLVGMVGMW